MTTVPALPALTGSPNACVAPKSSACSCFQGFGAIAKTYFAPAYLAPPDGVPGALDGVHADPAGAEDDRDVADAPGCTRLAQHRLTGPHVAPPTLVVQDGRSATIVAPLMTRARTAVRILDFISRASRRAKCHISSSVCREKRL